MGVFEKFDKVLISAIKDYHPSFDCLNEIEGELTLATAKGALRVKIVLPDNFPVKPPEFYCLDKNKLDLPHIEEEGQICYIGDANPLIDFHNHLGVILSSIDKVIRSINDAEDKYHEQFADEFEPYWNKSVVTAENSFFSMYSLVKISSSSKKIKIIAFEQPLSDEIKIKYFVAEDNSENWFGKTSLKKLGEMNSYLFYIKSDAYISPPALGEFWSFSFLENLLIKHFPNLRSIARKIYQKAPILLHIEQPNTKQSLVGIKFQHSDKVHPLASGKNCLIEPLITSRMDKDYMLPRAGGFQELVNKKVLVIGCGSVGSVLIDMITKAGVCNLTLVDPDLFSVDNVYRHTLGIEDAVLVGYKTGLLALRLDQSLPHVKIKPIRVGIETYLQENTKILESFDLIISCTAIPAVNMYINDVMHKLDNPPPAIFMWNEPLSLGGHVLFSDNKSGGCFQCIFKRKNHEDNLYNALAFYEKYQSFNQSVAGCGGNFIPFSYVDSNQTANIGVRLAIDYLKGKDVRNQTLSWKGSPDEFLDKGYELSNRFKLSHDQLLNFRYDFVDKGCHVCGSNNA